MPSCMPRNLKFSLSFYIWSQKHVYVMSCIIWCMCTHIRTHTRTYHVVFISVHIGKMAFSLPFLAIITNPTKNFDWRDYLYKAGVPLKPHTLLFLLVCGLRRVKDPLFIIHAFSDWHETHADVFLLIIGPELDPVLSAEVKNCTANMSGVWFVGPLPQAHLHAAMSSSFCLVNSSISEGMSGAILEAMDLGLPVVARTNSGNRSLIHHEETGLLFCTGREFVVQARRLIGDSLLRRHLITGAKNLLETSHSLSSERRTYARLVHLLI
uniref:Glycosyltransferase 1 domain containing 1 n=1 Tax=Eptatretus burgeri TaxID=7764 RepID=A0A8C4Q003_EPTBU